jgi:CDP-paratose 2-epimerase
MSAAIITGSAGLVGSEAVAYFASLGVDVVGIDNGMRGEFFGQEASTNGVCNRLCAEVPAYDHHDVDVRDADAISRIFDLYGRNIALIIHTGAQPSHDWQPPIPAWTSLSTPTEPPFCSRRHAICTGCRFHFHVNQQGLR